MRRATLIANQMIMLSDSLIRVIINEHDFPTYGGVRTENHPSVTNGPIYRTLGPGDTTILTLNYVQILPRSMYEANPNSTERSRWGPLGLRCGRNPGLFLCRKRRAVAINRRVSAQANTIWSRGAEAEMKVSLRHACSCT